MGFEIDGWKDVAACGWKEAAKPCDGCSSAGAVLFCQVDSAFLCLDCDSEIHGGGANSKRHRRVWMCEVCEQAPAAVFCKSDAATLCVTCDHDIHTANPLAHRHDRTPVQPFVDSAVKSCSLGLLVPTSNVADPPRDHEINYTWLLPTTNLSSKFDLEEHDMKSADLFSTKIDPFSDFEYQNSFHHQIYSNAAMDSVVPAQVTIKTVPDHHPVSHISMTNSENCFDIDFCRSKITALTHSHHPISQTVSSSSLEVGLVPDGNFSDTSFSFGRPERSGAVSGNTGCQTGKHSGGGEFDREARVLRYREKRKNRKFEKTIRYASRKAYAESRPRIKGRFAKRTAEMEAEAGGGIFSSDQAAAMAFLADTYYGVVPSF